MHAFANGGKRLARATELRAARPEEMRACPQVFRQGHVDVIGGQIVRPGSAGVRQPSPEHGVSGQPIDVRGFTVAIAFACFVISLLLLGEVRGGDVIVYEFGGWARPVGIEYRVDILNAFVPVVVSSVAAVVFSSGTAQAVLDHAGPGARLIFSCGWHITRDGRDVYSWGFKAAVYILGLLARLVRFAELDDQVEACRRIFASDTRWTVVRGSSLEEGESQWLPVWSRHVDDPILESNMTRRVDFALFMVEALENDEVIHEAPAIVGCQSPSALTYKTQVSA